MLICLCYFMLLEHSMDSMKNISISSGILLAMECVYSQILRPNLVMLCSRSTRPPHRSPTGETGDP